ncbi:MAG TPA: YHS domain-containing protein [Abditibacterium sp.]|jgi:YHS domain-containing protein
MKNLFLIPSLTPFVLLFASGCNQAPDSTVPPVSKAAATPVKLTSAQELAKYCRVCVLDKGEKMEEFMPSRLDKKYQGQTYKFCSEPCRKSFDAKPARYALAK